MSVDLASQIVDVPGLPRPGSAGSDITPLPAPPTGRATTGRRDRSAGHCPTVVVSLLTPLAR